MAELLIGVVTCSDTCHLGEREDGAGKAVADACVARGWSVVAYDVCPDDEECIVHSIIEMADVDEADVVFTVGGTGLGPRDITPEATRLVVEREIPGIAEAIRAHSVSITPRAMLSRAIAGQRGATIVINLPGSEKAARECYEAVAETLEHAAEMAEGRGHD